jgi:hypothetical protein
MGCLDDSEPENQSPLSRMLVPVDESKILDVKRMFDTQLVSSLDSLFEMLNFLLWCEKGRRYRDAKSAVVGDLRMVRCCGAVLGGRHLASASCPGCVRRCCTDCDVLMTVFLSVCLSV